MGRKYHQWIEAKLLDQMGRDWWLDNKPCEFPFLLEASQKNKFLCPEYEYRVLNDLRSHGLPVENQVIYLNRFIADIALPKARVILELDGPYHQHKLQQDKDEKRKELFNIFGFTYFSWKMPMTHQEYERRLGCFVRAYIKHAVEFPLKPINRPHAIEKATPQGLVQKAQELKRRKYGRQAKESVTQKP